GPTSHTAVLAKALGIPAVVSCPGVAALRSGQQVLVDGGSGEVTADPDADQVDTARVGPVRSAEPVTGPGRTADGHHVPLLAAVGGPDDVAEAIAAGAEGVG